MVLSGGEPARGSSRSVPMTEVVRAALARIDDDRVHVLVEIGQVDERRVAGGAAADVADLLAELIANAVAACSPVARVRVAGQSVMDRYALEVQDCGVGASSDEADRVRAPLVECVPQRLFALFERVACRHGVNVRLCRSAHGGINALVLLPRELLVVVGVVGVVGPGPSGAEPVTHAALPAAPDAPAGWFRRDAQGAADRRPGGRAGRAGEPQPGPRRPGGALPRRVPMTSMATGLRDSPDGSRQAPSRSPDEVRSFLSSYHDGIRRARTVAHPAAPGPADAGAARRRSTETPEGYAPPRADDLPDDEGAAALARLRDLVVPIAAGTPT